MKKAQARNTTCIDPARHAVALVAFAASVLASVAASTPALAETLPQGCFAREYSAQHLAEHPGQGVAALRLWFFHESDDPASSAALVEARMADQGQGARDGVGGEVLTQYALCDADGACFVECDGGTFETQRLPDGDLHLTTRFFALGEGDACGGGSDLAERPGEETRYRLSAAAPEICQALWQRHPLPEPGCYGMDYSDMGHGQGLLGLRLLLHPADDGYAFPQAEGTFRVTLPEGGRAAAAGRGGARLSVPVWCSTRDGLCRSGVDEGALAIAPLGDGVALSTGRFLIFGAEAANLDIAAPGQAITRHQLRPLPPGECRGME
ncbi:hypothetical protein [Pararhodobacter marinus]|uniref:hypothetical protein n=1 Tax=Pararhodobacter marinus TaxID=2184063 RepID=UPI0035149D46